MGQLKIVKKRVKIFKRHQADLFKRIGGGKNRVPSWRKPKGIDSSVRRRFKGTHKMPNIGYGSDKRTKFMLPNGKYLVRIEKPADVDVLLMHNDRYAAEIKSHIGARKRKDIIARADELGVTITNRMAKLKAEEVL